MVNFRAIIENLDEIGLYSVILPIILIYAVVFAILEKAKIFSSGESNNSQTKNINSIIAIVFALFSVLSVHTVLIIGNIIKAIILLIVFILVVLVVLAFIFGENYTQLLEDKDGNLKKSIAYTIAGLVILITLGVLFYITGLYSYVSDFFLFFDDSYDSFVTTLIILGIGFVMYLVTKDGK